MNVDVVMSQIIVTDAARAVAFYTTLFGRGPDAKPVVDATFVRVVQLEDPDRNRVVLTGAKPR